MADNYVMLTGDTVTVTFTGIVVPAAQKQPLIGTGLGLTVGGVPVCLKGDELPPLLKGPVTFSEPGYSIPGTGTLTLKPVEGVHYTKILKKGATPVLIKGTPFAATLAITTPAANPNGQKGSEKPQDGIATFETTNTRFTAA